MTAASVFSYFYREYSISNPHVSIIIPVYNTKAYLDECLNSAENQTFKEIEIICVNDESEDDSLNILKSHSRKDRRIRIINQNHAGLSAARNVGLKEARGEYILFLDSDDVIMPNACECAYKSAVENEAEVVEFGIARFEDGQSLNFNNFKYDERDFEVTQREKNENPFEVLKLNSSMVWDKLWKRSFIEENDLNFKDGLPYGEDFLFDWLAFPFLRKAVISGNIFYGYRTKRPGSIISTSNCSKILSSAVTILEEIFKSHERFKFPGGESWTIDKALYITFNRITKELENHEDKIRFSQKVLSLLDDYIEKYKIELSKDNQEKIDVLRSISNS